jgi:hypothetical protein
MRRSKQPAPSVLAVASIAVLLALPGLGCGRPLPEDEPVATGPVETGAFEEEPPPVEGDAAIRGAGTGVARDFALAVGEAYLAEDPTATLDVQDAEPDFEALCDGTIDLVAATGDPDEDVCGGSDAAVGFHLADSGGEPIVVYVNRESILRFEVEGLIQFAVDNGAALPSQAGAEPLSVDELQETQTKLERVIAGVE